ncbi:MAG TPA: hypothetical protein VLG28_02075 [Acidimicrobiia bacterium]|nr:hypothetical protein [Acidimicrobiia bacterium]
MKRWRTVALAAAVMLVAAACAGEVGAGTPVCLESPDQSIAAVTILQLQAVPDATWGPCIAELRVGWEYGEYLSQSGQSSFWLDSDRMGDRFIEARLTPACDTTGALPARSPSSGIERFVRVQESPGPIQVAIIPVAARHGIYASIVLAELDGATVEGRPLMPFVPVSNAEVSVQIQRALSNGQIAMIVDDREVATGTVELRRSGDDPEFGISVEEAIEDLEDDLGDPRYRAEWYHRFPGGCITYVINAEGSGAETIVSDIDDVLGFFPLAELRRSAADQGFDV